ncbi:hypothetical protein AVEN_202065-1 [Araneus ventricosus]|uniref:Uncharacterized protein n=1 Tax=Araneus ventricosus TaxID=182803 RepID=A0A4Y2K1M4_ARAVE|nr:hypothetical protein AVEN_202065-1 [Araneus ventricosus]
MFGGRKRKYVPEEKERKSGKKSRRVIQDNYHVKACETAKYLDTLKKEEEKDLEELEGTLLKCVKSNPLSSREKLLKKFDSVSRDDLNVLIRRLISKKKILNASGVFLAVADWSKGPIIDIDILQLIKSARSYGLTFGRLLRKTRCDDEQIAYELARLVKYGFVFQHSNGCFKDIKYDKSKQV